MQGHALLTRQAGSTAPCPYIDFDKGFNEWYAEAYNLDWRNGAPPPPPSMPSSKSQRSFDLPAAQADGGTPD